jgi:predicted HicB family RNase H-like nuclease
VSGSERPRPRLSAVEVVNTKDVITFQGTSVDSIEAEFRNSIDDYLAWCAEEGEEPERPYSGKFNLRLSPELHREAAIAAKQLGISLNNFVEKALQDELTALHS